MIKAKILTFTSKFHQNADISVMDAGITLWSVNKFSSNSQSPATCNLSSGEKRPPKEGNLLHVRVGLYEGGGEKDFYFLEQGELCYSSTGITQKFALKGTI